jgi:hypothetical protein
VLYLAALIAARIFLGKGLESLTSEEKGHFHQITRSTTKWSMLFTVVFIVLLMLAFQYSHFSRLSLFIMYLFALLLFNNGIIVAMVFKKLKSVGMSPFFMRKFILSSLIRVLAFVLMAAGILYWYQTQMAGV